jgi:hypothetical protein
MIHTPTAEESELARCLAFAASKAEEHRCKMEKEKLTERQAFKYVEKIIGDADVVFGVWADPEHPDGFDSIVIKGMHHIAECAVSSVGTAYRIDGVPCVCLEQAIAARNHFDRRH